MKKGTPKGKNHYEWKGGKTKKNCLICHKEFYATFSQIKLGRGKFCSRRCMGKWESKHWRGENNSNWKGGIAPIRERIMNSDRYKQWRQDVFIRDNFTCQKCGDKTSGNLEAHHKKPFSKLLEEVRRYLPLFNIYDGAILYCPLWDVDNGLTLCKKCHSKIRRIK